MEIDPNAFQEAFQASRSHPGMGSLKLSVQWNPYECEWVAEIDYSDNTRYVATGGTATDALQNVTRKLQDNPPKRD